MKAQIRVRVDKDDLFSLLDYIVLLGEKKDYEQYGTPRPKNHIWLTAKRIMKQVGYKGE